MKKVLSTLAAFGFIAAASPASADNHGTGFYGGVSGGYTFFNDLDASEITTATGAASGNYIVDMEGGWAGLANLGYNFGGFRLELEGGYRQSDIDTLSATNAAALPPNQW